MTGLSWLYMSLWMCLSLLICQANSESTTLNGMTSIIEPSVYSTPKSLSDSGFTHTKPIVKEQQTDFYSYECNADTYAPNLSSFSTIWALLNVLVIIISFIVYLMYLCFNKFVDTMTKA